MSDFSAGDKVYVTYADLPPKVEGVIRSVMSDGTLSVRIPLRYVPFHVAQTFMQDPPGYIAIVLTPDEVELKKS